jgi:hypothetical protein
MGNKVQREVIEEGIENIRMSEFHTPGTGLGVRLSIIRKYFLWNSLPILYVHLSILGMVSAPPH